MAFVNNSQLPLEVLQHLPASDLEQVSSFDQIFFCGHWAEVMKISNILQSSASACPPGRDVDNRNRVEESYKLFAHVISIWYCMEWYVLIIVYVIGSKCIKS